MNGIRKNTVQFYSHHAQELKRTQKDKIRKLIEFGCIEYDANEKHYICKPIKGYNTRTYKLVTSKEFGFVCNCQGFNAKLRKYRESPLGAPKPSCSHIGALYEHFALTNKKRNCGPFKQTTLEASA